MSNINAPEDLLSKSLSTHSTTMLGMHRRYLGLWALVATVSPFVLTPARRRPRPSIARPAPCVVSGPVRARLARLLAAPAEAPPRAPPPPQTNGASAPPPDAPEARSLSVVASSVMALGVLPGEELKRMLDNFCASLPPDEFKALLLSIGANLAPRVHKNLVLLLAPDAVSRLLDRTALAGYGDVGRNASRAALGRALPRRVAKTLVNRWLRDADAVELKRVVTVGLAKLGPGRLAELAPVCLAAIFGERPQVAPPPPAAPPAEEPVVLPATVAAWAAPRLALALGRDRRRAAVLRAIAGLSDGDARALLNDLSLSWAGAGRGDRDRQLADVVDIALSDPSEPRNGERARARAGKESEIPNFKDSSLGRFPLVSADFWTSDHLSERSRSVNAFTGTRARGTLTLKRT